VQVEPDGTRRYLGDQLGCVFNIVVSAHDCLATKSRLKKYHGVGLWFVVLIEASRSIIRDANMWRRHAKLEQPSQEICMWLAVTHIANRRRPMHDAYDQLCLLQVWHRLVPALELRVRQTVAGLQRRRLAKIRDLRRRAGAGRNHG
jgi:hypothetical protein